MHSQNKHSPFPPLLTAQPALSQATGLFIWLACGATAAYLALERGMRADRAHLDTDRAMIDLHWATLLQQQQEYEAQQHDLLTALYANDLRERALAARENALPRS